MKDGLHITSVYKSTLTKEERNWAPRILAVCAFVLIGYSIIQFYEANEQAKINASPVVSK